MAMEEHCTTRAHLFLRSRVAESFPPSNKLGGARLARIEYSKIKGGIPALK